MALSLLVAISVLTPYLDSSSQLARDNMSMIQRTMFVSIRPFASNHSQNLLD